MYYNTALVAVETNLSTYPVRELERLRYPRQYVRECPDDYTHRRMSAYGFRTDQKTRPLLISNLVAYVREHPEDVYDADTIYEMLTFIRTEEFRAEAAAGAHDDLVMSLGIAYLVRDSQSCEIRQSQAHLEWSSSMYDDFKNARGKTRDYLREIWGTPPKRKR